MIVNYRYWNKIRNCGDAITAYILRDRLGVTPRTVAPDETHLLATGSIFFWANAHSHIWGSGIIRPGAKIKLPSAQIHAVRGRKTLAALQAARPEIGDLPLGDPGILVDYLLDDPGFAGLPVTHEVALVPHHRAISQGKLRVDRDDVCTVDMRDNTLLPLRQIQQSRVVVSQSLHGLVFAAALGKPYVWISDDPGEEWAFKFADWFSTTENPQAMPLAADTPLDTLIAAAELRPCTVDRVALIAALPRDIVRADTERPLLDFELCRALPIAVVRTESFAKLCGADGDETSLARAAARLRKDVRHAFGDWSEMPYVLLMEHGAPMPSTDLADLARFMDRHPGIEALTLLPRGAAPADEARVIRRFSSDLTEVSEGARFEPGGGLLLRPSLPFEPSLATYSYRAR